MQMVFSKVLPACQFGQRYPSPEMCIRLKVKVTKSRKCYVTLSHPMLQSHTKGALALYGKLTWESAHAWILKILCYLIVWGITLIFMVRLSFYAIPLLIYDVMNDITIIH